MIPAFAEDQRQLLLESWSSRLVNLFIRPAFADLERANEPKPHLKSHQFVRSAFDFAVLTITHVERVARLGAEICERFPTVCQDLKPADARMLLRALHDREKLDYSSAFLNMVGWQDRSHPTDHLLQSYGLNQTDPEEIAALNRAGDQVRRAFLLGYGLVNLEGHFNEVGEAYLIIEKIADMVDTGLAPERHEEFGRPMIKASEMLKAVPLEAFVAEYLEVNYERLTFGLHYADLRQPLWDLIALNETKLMAESCDKLLTLTNSSR
jgi:hypothetical protein